MTAPSPKQATIAVWGGETGHERYERATQVPVVHSVSFGYADLDSWQAVARGREPGHIYSRNSNPTVRAFEEKIRDLERAQAATRARPPGSAGNRLQSPSQCNRAHDRR